MKRSLCAGLVFLMSCLQPVFCQAEEAQQLLLNWEKLVQLKKILSNMYNGYRIVSKGYNAVRDISKGNFNLHRAFLDGLFEVSPAVKKYHKVADIINCQFHLVKEYRTAFNRFKISDVFTEKEIGYMGDVYGRLLDQSVQNLDDLAMVITAKKLRMTDDERLAAIDRIYNDMNDKLAFLKSFNKGNHGLATQRLNDNMDARVLRDLYGIR